MSEELIRMKAKERHFLEQLLDGKKLENYKIPVPIKAELRKYQQVRACTSLSRTVISSLVGFYGKVVWALGILLCVFVSLFFCWLC